MQWVEETAQRRDFEREDAQLALSMAAIITTSGLFQQTLIEISKKPELIQPLRKEIESALEGNGWSAAEGENKGSGDHDVQQQGRRAWLSIRA